MVQSEKIPVDFFTHLDGVKKELTQKEVLVFLDYDGTLTPIVDRPDMAIISDDMRETVRTLSQKYKVSIVSGRATDDVKSKVKIDGVFYAGSHGFEIVDPQGKVTINQEVKKTQPAIDEAYAKIKKQLSHIKGFIIEHVKYTVSVHYRMVADEDFPQIEEAVNQTLKEFPQLRKTSGKKVFELRPKIDWHKGKAVEWILNVLEANHDGAVPVYIGDDTTDEDAFRSIKDKGFGILVADPARASEAQYFIQSTTDVKKVLELFIGLKA